MTFSDAAFSAAIVVASACLSALVIAVLRPLFVRHLLAHPNERSSHMTPTPAGAGFGVMAAVLAVGIALLFLHLVPTLSLTPILIGAMVLTALGGLDDAYPLPVLWRLLMQGAAAILAVATLPADFQILPLILPLLLERALLALGIVAFVNVINFLDGLDWMTVAQVVPMTLGIATFWWLGLLPESIGFLALALLGAMFGFAIFNKHPASIFLGDSGSLPIGLILAYMLIWVAETHIVSAVLLALYTIADSGLTFFRRLMNGEKVTAAHRTHFYQRATTGGFSVPQVTNRVFLVCSWLAVLAIGAALAQSLLADVLAFVLGAGGVALVLKQFAQGR